MSAPLSMDEADRRVISEIATEASALTGIPAHRILSRERDAATAHARQAVMWAAQKVEGLSLARIGRAMSHRDHTTVIHAMRAVEARRATCPDNLRLTETLLVAATLRRRLRVREAETSVARLRALLEQAA